MPALVNKRCQKILAKPQAGFVTMASLILELLTFQGCTCEEDAFVGNGYSRSIETAYPEAELQSMKKRRWQQRKRKNSISLKISVVGETDFAGWIQFAANG